MGSVRPRNPGQRRSILRSSRHAYIQFRSSVNILIHLKKVFSYCEEAQERAFLEGKSSIYTLNGYLYLKQIGAKKIGNKINAQFKRVPPKTKIEYRANERIRDLNEALRRMSFENISPEDLGLNEDGEE